jgi:hypothetical protein
VLQVGLYSEENFGQVARLATKACPDATNTHVNLPNTLVVPKAGNVTSCVCNISL